MIAYRLRGLLNLHILVTTGLVIGMFLGFAAIAVHVPWILLLPGLNLMTCVFAIMAAMVVSARSLAVLRNRFHAMNWKHATWLATRQVVLMALALFTLIVATKDRSISRIFLAHFLVLAWLLLTVANRFLPGYLASLAFDGLNRLPTLFVGDNVSLELLDAWIVQKKYLGVSPVGFLSDDYMGTQRHVLGDYLGRSTELKRAIDEKRAAQVVLLNVPADREETRRIIEICQLGGCRLLIHDNVAERLPIPMIATIEEDHFFFTTQQEPLEDPLNRAIKRTFDLAVSLPTVVLILPLLCFVVWIVQRFQAPGPLLFVRPRGGRAGAEFPMLKFRSMYINASGPDADREAEQAQPNDGRIYPFGAFLRRTSLDEMPQFWNVFRGEMSVVGPRPHLPKHDYEFSRIARVYRTRQLVKPGITGLAQIRGLRGEIIDPGLLHERVRLDIEYITSWSIGLDLLITGQTFVAIFVPPKTAY